jgi:hypothetical protein
MKNTRCVNNERKHVSEAFFSLRSADSVCESANANANQV